MEVISSVSKETLLKVSAISPNGIAYVIDRSTFIFVAHSTGLQIYDVKAERFLDQVKLKNYSGTLTCICASDQLAFFCCGMKVIACATNGKIIFEFDTYLATDKIQSIHVHGYRLWVVAGNMLNEFLVAGAQLSNKRSRSSVSSVQKTQDINSIVFQAKINHSLLLFDQNQKPFLLLLLQNNLLQIIEKKQVETTFKLNNPPTFAISYPTLSNKILIGTASGDILYFQITKKSIKQLFSVPKGIPSKVLTMVELGKTGFLVFGEKQFYLWSPMIELVGSQKIDQKVVSAVYNPNNLLIYIGCASGLIQRIGNYSFSKKNRKDQDSEKNNLINDITTLKQKIIVAKSKLKNSNSKSAVKPNLKHTIVVDFANLCLQLDLSCDRPLNKLNLIGDIELLTSDQDIITKYQHEERCIYIIPVNNQMNISVKFRLSQTNTDNVKINFVCYTKDSQKVLALLGSQNLKVAWLWQKVSNNSEKLVSACKLVTEGDFKYFDANYWLNCIFSDFGAAGSDSKTTLQIQYQSILTKARASMTYSDHSLTILAEDSSLIAQCRDFIINKAREKNQNLSINTEADLSSLVNFLNKVENRMISLQQLRKKFELIPGLAEIKQQIESPELLNLESQSVTIIDEYKKTKREAFQLTNNIKVAVLGFLKLKGKSINTSQVEQLLKLIGRFSSNAILSFVRSKLVIQNQI